jgi:hypothetical protein
MARLPSGDYIIQQLGNNDVFVFEDHTERQIARFNPTDHDQLVEGLATIGASDLSDDDKAMALFWCGYFYAYAREAQR